MMIAGLVAKGFIVTATVQRARSNWCNHVGAELCRQFDEECASPVHIFVWTTQRNFVHIEWFYYTVVPCVTFLPLHVACVIA